MYRLHSFTQQIFMQLLHAKGGVMDSGYTGVIKTDRHGPCILDEETDSN